jgi:lauroyl/myristoyl acyltransferase
MNEDGIYDYELTDPIKLDQHPTRLDTIKKNAEKILKTIEPHIKRFPEQWLMYHPVWPQAKEETG